ncbi:hypothetical protein [Longimicrobium sp.]
MSAPTTRVTETSGIESGEAKVRRPFVAPTVETLGSLETQTLLTVVIP